MYDERDTFLFSIHIRVVTCTESKHEILALSSHVRTKTPDEQTNHLIVYTILELFLRPLLPAEF